MTRLLNQKRVEEKDKQRVQEYNIATLTRRNIGKFYIKGPELSEIIG